MRLLWKYIRYYFLVYHLISHFLLYLQNYKEFEAKILDLQSEKYGLSFDIKKYTTSGWALGDENVIGVRAFKQKKKTKQNKTKQNKNKTKQITVSKWRPHDRISFCVISISAKIWRTTFPKEFLNEIWLIMDHKYINIGHCWNKI